MNVHHLVHYPLNRYEKEKVLRESTTSVHYCIKPVKKLTQHLEQMHPEVSHSERLRLSKASQCAPGQWARKPRPQPPTQKSITCFLSWQRPVDDDGQDHGRTVEGGRDNDWSDRECDWSGEEGDWSSRESNFSSREDWMSGGRGSEVSGHQDAADPKAKPFLPSAIHPFLVGLDRYLQSRQGAVSEGGSPNLHGSKQIPVSC